MGRMIRRATELSQSCVEFGWWTSGGLRPNRLSLWRRFFSVSDIQFLDWRCSQWWRFYLMDRQNREVTPMSGSWRRETQSPRVTESQLHCAVKPGQQDSLHTSDSGGQLQSQSEQTFASCCGGKPPGKTSQSSTVSSRHWRSLSSQQFRLSCVD